jgi:ribosomal protein S4
LVIRRLAMVVAVLFFSTAAAAEQFLVEAELWLDGERYDVPVMIVTPDEVSTMSPLADSSRLQWRLDVEVERADDHMMAPDNALWVHVGIHQKIDGEWEHLTDSILGVPEGETAILSVVDGDAEAHPEASPETSAVYLRIKTSRLRPAANP